jgi:hypothetical protein
VPCTNERFSSRFSMQEGMAREGSAGYTSCTPEPRRYLIWSHLRSMVSKPGKSVSSRYLE